MIVSPDSEHIKKAAALLVAGELVSFPTETVYGLGAHALSEDACKKIYQLKARPPINPLIVHIWDIEQAKSLIDPNCSRETIEVFYTLALFWPGPLTIVMPKSSVVPSIVSGGTDSVGIRIPNHPVALTLLHEAGIPVAAPSANISNYVSPTTAQHVYENFGEKIGMILDGGMTSIGIESTVISLLDPSKPAILRPGAITQEMIEETLGFSISNQKGSAMDAPLSPGLLPIHYAPHTKLVFVSKVDLDTLMGQKIGYIAFSEGKNLAYDFSSIIVLSHNNNLSEIAAKLYSALQEMDSQELDLIVIDECIESGVGEAIMDRLNRAIKRFK